MQEDQAKRLDKKPTRFLQEYSAEELTRVPFHRAYDHAPASSKASLEEAREVTPKQSLYVDYRDICFRENEAVPQLELEVDLSRSPKSRTLKCRQREEEVHSMNLLQSEDEAGVHSFCSDVVENNNGGFSREVGICLEGRIGQETLKV